MKTKVKIQIYEIDGEDTGVHYPELTIERHWNRYRDMIVLKRGKKKFTVSTRDLERAIKSVTAD